jgi:sirohydrochlorin cobaltochelatase
MDTRMTNLENLPNNCGLLICGHGSRAKIAEQEFSLLAKNLRQRYPKLKIEYGFLEYSAPNIHMALDALREQGVKTIYAVPGMLFAATHAQNDIPSVLTSYQQKHPDLHIHYGRELGLHSNMIAAFQQRILNALGHTEIPAPGALYDTMLVVVGRGTSVVNANADAAKLCRIAAESLGFGWSETVYSGVTFPSVGRGLEMACKLGFKKIVVAPYFLFGGRLIDRIHSYIDKVAAEQPEVQFIKADYLRDHPKVIDTFVARFAEAMNGSQQQTGLLADFSARLARGEVDLHHHHAEYQEPNAAHQHSHDHNHPHSHSHEQKHSHEHEKQHDHGHSHAHYQHIAHPHGPRTMINDNVCCCFMSQFPAELIAEEQARKPALDGIPACKKRSA